MSEYVRFQTNLRSDPALWPPLGVFYAAGELEDENKVRGSDADALDENLRWFNTYLPVPKITERDRRCLFWFRLQDNDHLWRIWRIVDVLERHDVKVRFVKTSDPGSIVYRDEFQIAAIPSQRILKSLRV